MTDYIDDNLPRLLPLDELSALAHMSRFHFARLFKQSTGLPPHRFIVRRRIDRACALLEERALTVGAIAKIVGFDSPSHFSKTFHRVTGRAPGAYRGRSRAPRGPLPGRAHPPQAS